MFGMDRYNINELHRYAETLKSSTHVKLLGDFNPEGDRIIADPYFDNKPEDFEKCFDQITASCSIILKKLIAKEL